MVQYLKSHDLWLKRSMGQNFLIDQKILKKIISAAEIKPTDAIVEIGPGLGILTTELAKHAGKVIAIEKDEKLAEILESGIMNHESWRGKIKIINQDILKIQNSEFRIHDSRFKVVANIPYNITSAIIRKFLEAENKPSIMVLLVQKEVAQRICAKSGEMSLISVAVQFYAEPKIVATVPASSFFPVPKVDSAIIKIKIKNQKSCLPAGRAKIKIKEEDFFRMVKFGFAARRKTLENNLAAGFHITKSRASDIIKKAGLPENIRAQELSIEDWVKLYRKIYGRRSEKIRDSSDVAVGVPTQRRREN